MTNFTNVFSGSVIQPAEVSYLPVTLTADITLDWPLESNAPTYPAAGTIDVTSTVGAYAITLPDATQGSAGTAILFNGLSANTQSVTVKNNSGTTVATIASGTQWLLVLAATSTAGGTWRAFQLGATTSAATAASLAGYGIVASSGLLSQAAAVTTFSSSPRTVLVTDRASLMVWTGTGSATFNLPAAATAGNNFFVMARNSGGGDMTVDPSGSETINGSTTVALHPGDSAFLITDGIAWYSVGLGRDAAFAFDFTSISLAGAAATYTLSGAELNRVAYKFTGLLTNDVAVVVPATVQQYWAENATTGAFAVTLKTSGGTPVTVTQGGRDIYYCNGTNVVRATTGGIAVPIGVTDGGTGLASYATGDIVYASGATTLGKLADVATGNALLSGGVGVAPAYGKVGLTTHVSGTLPAANGGTGITALGTGVATALGINVGSAGAVVTFNGALGTPGSGTATNLTGLPVSTGISGLGTGVATMLATFTSANIATACSDETGSGSLVFSVSPTLTGSPLAPTAAPGTNTTQIASTAFVTAAVAAAGGMTYPAAGIANSTGSAWTTSYTVSGTGTVLAATVSPAFTTPNIGTPSAGTLTSCTGLPISTGVSGLGTGVATMLGTFSSANILAACTDETGTGSLVFSASPTLTGTPLAPTAVGGTNTTQIATTAFVTSAVAAGGSMVYPGAGIPVSTGSAWTTSLSSTAPTFTTSVTSPLVNGGTTASLALVIQSTSGAGTSDSIAFKTGSQVQAGKIGTTGNWSFGTSAPSTDTCLWSNHDITGATIAFGMNAQNLIKSGVTNTATIYGSTISTEAAAFTLSLLNHFAPSVLTVGAGSAITEQRAFTVGATLTQAATNYAYYSALAASGTARWNVYMAGSAPNYMAGDLRIGTTTQSGTNSLTVSGGAAVSNITYSTSYTVATLPTGVQGMRAYVTDATAPTFLGALTGGGAVKCPVFYNGSAWVAG